MKQGVWKPPDREQETMRMKRLLTSTEQVVPVELRGSPPRAVSLSAAGWGAITLVVLLTAGSVVLAAYLFGRLAADRETASRLMREGGEAEATVTSVRQARGGDAQTNLRYRYTVGGNEYSGSGRLRKRDPRRLTIREGSQIGVRYLPSAPSRSWIAGQEPRGMPPLIAALLPAICFPVAGLVLGLLRRKRRLLAEGRVTMARITRVDKRKGGEQTTWRVHYEWTLLNGSVRTGRTDRTRAVPSAGTFVPVLYDRDNPKRHALYPMSLLLVRRA
jgi:hypothetical protein